MCMLFLFHLASIKTKIIWWFIRIIHHIYDMSWTNYQKKWKKRKELLCNNVQNFIFDYNRSETFIRSTTFVHVCLFIGKLRHKSFFITSIPHHAIIWLLKSENPKTLLKFDTFDLWYYNFDESLNNFRLTLWNQSRSKWCLYNNI